MKKILKAIWQFCSYLFVPQDETGTCPGGSMAVPNRYHVSQLVRLNRELDGLYELIYNDWRTITEEDYKMFGGQFVILIQTIKQLYDACKKQPKAMGLSEETKRLGMNV